MVSNQSDSLFRYSIQITQKFVASNLPNVYQDYARLHQRRGHYQTGIYYLRKAIKLSGPEKKPLQRKTRLIQLSRMYLQNKQLDSAQLFLDQAMAIPQTSLKSTIFLLATEGLFHFINRNDSLALQSYHRCDSLLLRLRTHSSHPIQQKYARKMAYEVYQSAHELLHNLWFYGDQARFEQPKAWFEQRLSQEKTLYESIRVSVALKDSLVVARSAPKTKVVRKLNPWWWALMIAVLVVGGWPAVS